MIKDITKYILIGGLLYGGHYFLATVFPDRGLTKYRDLSQVVLFLLFVKSHLFGFFLSKKFDVLPGQIFLGFSVFKLIVAGLFMMFLKMANDAPVSKSFTLVFMVAYFSYLIVDVVLMMKAVKEKEAF